MASFEELSQNITISDDLIFGSIQHVDNSGNLKVSNNTNPHGIGIHVGQNTYDYSNYPVIHYPSNIVPNPLSNTFPNQLTYGTNYNLQEMEILEVLNKILPEKISKRYFDRNRYALGHQIIVKAFDYAEIYNKLIKYL